MSWKPEVVVQSGNWLANALRFGTKQEAELYLADLSSNWSSLRETRVVECDDPVNYAWRDGRVAFLERR